MWFSLHGFCGYEAACIHFASLLFHKSSAKESNRKFKFLVRSNQGDSLNIIYTNDSSIERTLPQWSLTSWPLSHHSSIHSLKPKPNHIRIHLLNIVSDLIIHHPIFSPIMIIRLWNLGALSSHLRSFRK